MFSRTSHPSQVIQSFDGLVQVKPNWLSCLESVSVVIEELALMEKDVLPPIGNDETMVLVWIEPLHSAMLS